MSKKQKTEIKKQKTNIETQEPAKKKKDVYSFPTKSRCPRCGSTDTLALSTNGDRQYRRCQMAVCKWRYAVRGKKI